MPSKSEQRKPFRKTLMLIWPSDQLQDLNNKMSTPMKINGFIWLCNTMILVWRTHLSNPAKNGMDCYQRTEWPLRFFVPLPSKRGCLSFGWRPTGEIDLNEFLGEIARTPCRYVSRSHQVSMSRHLVTKVCEQCFPPTGCPLHSVCVFLFRKEPARLRSVCLFSKRTCPKAICVWGSPGEPAGGERWSVRFEGDRASTRIHSWRRAIPSGS